MRRTDENSRAVSGVVGEMLMIGIVLVLAAVFTAQLPNYLPSERSPTVTIMMSNDTLGNVTLWHKGGDWVKINTLKVIVSNKTYQATYTSTGQFTIHFCARPRRTQQLGLRSRGEHHSFRGAACRG